MAEDATSIDTIPNNHNQSESDILLSKFHEIWQLPFQELPLLTFDDLINDLPTEPLETKMSRLIPEPTPLTDPLDEERGGRTPTPDEEISFDPEPIQNKRKPDKMIQHKIQPKKTKKAEHNPVKNSQNPTKKSRIPQPKVNSKPKLDWHLSAMFDNLAHTTRIDLGHSRGSFTNKDFKHFNTELYGWCQFLSPKNYLFVFIDLGEKFINLNGQNCYEKRGELHFAIGDLHSRGILRKKVVMTGFWLHRPRTSCHGLQTFLSLELCQFLTNKYKNLRKV